MAVVPLAPRHYIETTGSGLLISIPSRKKWYLIIFMGIWIVGWAFGEVTVGGLILKGLLGNGTFGGPPPLVMLIWFTLWTVGGVFALYTVLWQLVGKEEIEIDSHSITISQVIFSVRRSKEYTGKYIKDLRTSPMGINEMHNWSRSLAIYGIGGGIIVFDYGAATIRFGNGIDEAEGKQIIAEIQQKYSQYKKEM